MSDIKYDLELYVVQNKTGQFLRSKGYGGSGEKWVDEINRARFYPKIGPARSQVTWYSNHYPQYGIPKIVKLKVVAAEILDEKERVQNSQKAQLKRELEHKRKRTQQEKEHLLKQEEEIRKRLKELE